MLGIPVGIEKLAARQALIAISAALVNATADLFYYMAALRNRCGHYIFAMWLLVSFFLA